MAADWRKTLSIAVRNNELSLVTMAKRPHLLQLLLSFLLCTAVGVCTAEQQSAPAQQQPSQQTNGVQQEGAPAQQTAPAAAPEHHITPQEAQELFRSIDKLLVFASEHTGLPIRHEVKKKLATRQDVAKYVEDRMKEQGNGERFDRSALSLKKLGLLPQDFNFRQYMLGLYKEQVEGWYDARTKTVYLLDWVDPESQKPVMAHELVHALQDQNYDLEKWLQVADDAKDETAQMALDEQRTARQSIVEGQAMVVLFDYQLTPLGRTVQDAPDIVDYMQQSMLSEGSTPMYEKAPLYLREATLFPYTYGMNFVRNVMANRDKETAFAGVMKAPPLNTRQVMQPRTYLNGEKQFQVTIAPIEKALGSDWRRIDSAGVGEADLYVIARQWGGEEAANKLYPEWRGGYYMTVRRKNAANDAPVSLAMILQFANEKAVAEFALIYATELKQRYKSVQPAGDRQWTTDQGRVQLVVAGDKVVALESFSPEEAAKVSKAMLEAARTPYVVSPIGSKNAK